MTDNANGLPSYLTDVQKKAILDRDKNMLISASAGSGKTSVLIERIKDIIRKHEADVTEILVVTFTKAAASEMKERLTTKLEEIEPKSDYILEQLSNINIASVSTLHSFCARLLKTYFYYIGLDPSFVLIDEIESTALKSKALTKLIDGKFVAQDKEFFELLDIFSINRKEDNFREIILKLYNYMLTQIDPDEWFNKTISLAYNTNLEKNICAEFVNNYIIKEFAKLTSEADSLLSRLSAYEQAKMIEVVNSIYINLLKIKPTNNFELNSTRIGEFEKVKSIPTKVEDSMQGLKEELKLFKTKYTKLKELAEKNYNFDKPENISKRLKVTKERIVSLYGYTKEFKAIYDSLKKEKVSLDFSDLEEFTLELLKNQDVASEVCDKYKFIFVDEYQDTNLVQEEILRRISRPNNLFMVGDVKQSIYKFRASEPEIFVNKYKAYSSGKDKLSEVINLNDNFRSHQDVLDFSNIVFNKNMTEDFGQVDYKAEAQLSKGGKMYPVVNNLPTVSVYTIGGFKQEKQELVEKLPVYSVKNHEEGDSKTNLKKAECEGKLIVSLIKNMLGKERYLAKQDITKFIEYGDIAILTANRGAYLELVLKELEKAKIPYSSDIELGVFEDSYVSALRSFLSLLNNPEQDMHLFSVLNSKLFDFSIDELSKIRELEKDSKFYYEALRNAKNNSGISARLKQKIEYFYSTLDKFSYLSKFLKVDELLIEIINYTGFKNKIILDEGSEKSISMIDRLVSFLNGKSYNLSLNKFLDYIKDNEIKFGMEGETNGVRVSTIHKSKGLEYPVVILMGAGQPLLNKRNRGEFLISKTMGVGIDFYDNNLRVKQKTIVKNAISLELDRSEKEERLRLLYVALTRAINNLIVIGCAKDDYSYAGAENASTFLDWIIPSVIDAKDYGKGKYINLVSLNQADFDKAEQAITQKLVIEPKCSSVGGATSTILDVFKYVYPYEKEVSMPTKTTVSEILKEDNEDTKVNRLFVEPNEGAIEKGLAYHKLLSIMNLKVNTAEALDIEIDRLCKLNKITKEELKRIKKSDILNLLQNPKFREILSGKIIREQEFIASSGGAGSCIIQGIVDIISVTDDGIIVIDYKTNNSKNEEYYIKTYAKQLEIYADVVSRSLNKKIIKRLIYSFALNKFILV